jgi:hypothetical protein
MTQLSLLKQLKDIWYLNYTEDANKKPCVVRHNVLPYLVANPQLLEYHGDIWNSLCDVAGDYPSDDCYYGDSADAMYRKAEAASIQSGQLTAEAFVNATALTSIGRDVHIRATMHIAISLGINIDEDVVNPAYFDQAFDDELCPLQAALDLKDKP